MGFWKVIPKKLFSNKGLPSIIKICGDRIWMLTLWLLSAFCNISSALSFFFTSHDHSTWSPFLYSHSGVILRSRLIPNCWLLIPLPTDLSHHVCHTLIYVPNSSLKYVSEPLFCQILWKTLFQGSLYSKLKLMKIAFQRGKLH